MEEKLTAIDNKNSTTKWRPLKAKLIEWQTYNNNYSKELENSFASLLKQSSTISIVLILVIIVITSSLIFVISRYIVNQVRIFKDGLESFFAFLNRETNRCKHIDIKSKDEFGEMATFVNENVIKVENMIKQDNELIEDAQIVMKRVNNGWYSQL